MNVSNLMNITSVGHKYTLRGAMMHDRVSLYAKLDRALCNDSWRLQFPDAQTKFLTRMKFSYYHLILVSLKDNVMPKWERNFKFDCA